MVLVDTSVWVDHFRHSNKTLENLLTTADAACHPFIIGELACVSLRNRKEILGLLGELTQLEVVDNAEILLFIDHQHLSGKGIGLVDVHLLAAALMEDALVWSLDKRLMYEATRLRVAFD